MTNPFTNPRSRAEITDYPLGGAKRGLCVFQVEKHPTRGYRMSRTTTGKPKCGTYHDLTCIVDGPNNRTFLLQWSRVYRMVSIYDSKFKTALSTHIGGLQNTVCPKEGDENHADAILYNELLRMMTDATYKTTIPEVK